MHTNADVYVTKLDISDDGFLSLMNEDGDTKDDVKMPDGEIGEKITRLFKTEEKDTSALWLEFPNRTMLVLTPSRRCDLDCHGRGGRS